MSEWQPIETVPHMTFVLGYFGTSEFRDPCDMCVCRRVPKGWRDDVGDELEAPTHWMPLPGAPA